MPTAAPMERCEACGTESASAWASATRQSHVSQAINAGDIEWNEEWCTNGLISVILITHWKASEKNSSSLYRIAVSLGPKGNVPFFSDMIEEVRGLKKLPHTTVPV